MRRTTPVRCPSRSSPRSSRRCVDRHPDRAPGQLRARRCTTCSNARSTRSTGGSAPARHRRRPTGSTSTTTATSSSTRSASPAAGCARPGSTYRPGPLRASGSRANMSELFGTTRPLDAVGCSRTGTRTDATTTSTQFRDGDPRRGRRRIPARDRRARDRSARRTFLARVVAPTSRSSPRCRSNRRRIGRRACVQRSM